MPLFDKRLMNKFISTIILSLLVFCLFFNQIDNVYLTGITKTTACLIFYKKRTFFYKTDLKMLQFTCKHPFYIHR